MFQHYSSGTLFNENIIVSSTNGQGIQFCTGNATATATLAASKTISIGPAGFSAGTLLLKQFTQVGSTAQTLNQTSGFWYFNFRVQVQDLMEMLILISLK
jgi:hypothetical protein